MKNIKRFNENQETNYWSNSWDEIYDDNFLALKNN